MSASAIRRALGRAPHAGGAAAPPADDARRARYARLARVAIRHTFYNADGGECRDFVVTPTASTAALMRTLGVLFKPEAGGFSVLHDELRGKQLVSYLRGQRTARGAWTRLSFLLSPRNPYFINSSSLPVDTNPSRRNFYFTNQEAHRRGPTVLLAPGTRVTGEHRVRVNGGQLAEPANDSVRSLEVVDIAGEEVLSKPRCVPGEAEPGEPPRCADTLFFDLTTLPEDLYTVREVRVDGTTADRAPQLYTSLYPIPLCFVNLFFSDPDGSGAGVYPVTLDEGGQGGRVECVEYTLRFTRRATWWSYYVVPQPPGGELYDLRIREVVDAAAGGAPRVRFLGPCRVRLAGGALAWRFLSSRPLPLEQRSALHLRLTGRNARMTHADVLMDRLPVPSSQQVLPIPPEVACQEAWAALADPAAPGTRCERLLKRVCAPPAGARASGAEPPSFSEIYVYV